MKISVLVPVYREIKRADDIVAKILANDWQDKEMIVVVDGETTPAIEAALDPYRDRISVRYNGCQLGKAASINHVAMSLDTDVILMMDNDIDMSTDPAFLAKLAACMNDNDLAEIPKEGAGKSLIARMMAFEFLTNAMLSYTMARSAGYSPSMNGAAFAVRASLFRELGGFRAVVNEDMDFAARAFKLRARFGYPVGLKVRNDAPETLKQWLVQRKRWALNNVLWLKDNFTSVVGKLLRMPAFYISALVMLFPFICNAAIFVAARCSDFSLTLPFLFIVTQHVHALTGLLLRPSTFALLSLDGWLATVAGLLFASVVFFGFSRILRFKFQPLDFILFYLVYSPVWMISNLVMFGAVLFGADVKVDWKIAKS
jgi:cellulose synthase/poly-beta-1,6-N-acetylglucosamine synthase-like glycosyltransferase